MFEREIKFIYDFNLNKVNRLGPYFTFEQLAAAELHPAILQYISAEIDYLIYEDRQKLLKNSLFDYSGEKISYLFNQISDEVKRSKRFSQEYISKLILHASSFNINYLVRPKWTLTKFVYDEESIKSSSDIKQILNYLYYYRHISKILISYINSKKILSMNLTEFEELLERTDRLGVDSYLKSILDNALKSMGEFFNIGEIQKTKIPLSAVEMFLEEKELGSYLRKVTDLLGADGNARFGIQDYQKIFNSIMEEREETLPQAEMMETEETEIETPEREEPAVEEREISEEEPYPLLDETEEEKADLEDREDVEEIVVNSGIHHEEESEPEPDEPESEPEEEEIIISAPVKYRIKINEDNRIEPVEADESAEESEPVPDENFDAEIDEEEIDEEIDEENEGEFQEELEESEDLNDEPRPEPEASEDLSGETEKEKLDPEEISDDDESFLRSLRDQEEFNFDDVVKSDDELPFGKTVHEDSAEPENQKISEEKKSEWPEYKINEDEMNFYNSHKDEDESKSGVDLTHMLEHRDMTKIIETIFDYDIEDFANTLDEITGCRNEDDALIVVNQTLKNRHISTSSKEAELFKTLISQYFNH